MKSLLALGSLAAATIIAVAVTACGSGSSTTVDPNADGGNVTDGGNSLADAAPTGTVGGGAMLKLLAPLAVTLPAGRQKDIIITRAGDAAHAVALSVSGLPAGVTAMDATIGSMQAMATITLVADANAVPMAAPVTITVKGSTSAIMASTTFPLTVAGAPGSLDNSWGTKGITAGLVAIGSQATGIGLQKNGSVVVGGYVNDQVVVARYTTAGVLDATFGTAGQTRTAPAGQTQRNVPTTKLVVDKNDASIIACQWKIGGPLSFPARFTASGAPDTTLGAGGFGSGPGKPVNAVTSDAAGNVLMAGAGFITRQSSAGVPDPNFNIGSIDLGALRTAQGIAIQSSGRIVATGIDGNLPGGVIWGFATTGFPDATFAGGSGMISGTDGHSWLGLALDKNDTIYGAGQESGTKLLVGKITKDGVVDNSWNGNGVYSLAVGDVGQASRANDVVVQPDGKVIAVGSAVNSGRSVMLIVRFLASGVLDTSFGKDGTGIVFLPVASATSDANAVALQPDGKILVAGHGDQDWAVARFWP